MPRTLLTDEGGNTLSSLMRHSGRVYNKAEHRMTLEGIFYRMRIGCLWRDTPAVFGQWNTVFRRFNLWSKKGILQLLFKWLSHHADSEWLFIYGSIIRAYQYSASVASGEERFES